MWCVYAECRYCCLDSYNCNLLTHHFKVSNKNSSRIVYDVDLVYSNTISEQNHLTRAVGGTLIIYNSFSHPCPTSLVMYVSCKQIMSYFLSLKYVNVEFCFSFDRST